MELHKFNPNLGSAIVRVGENAWPEQESGGKVRYTWGSLDLLNDQKFDVLQECKDPFEPYAG